MKKKQYKETKVKDKRSIVRSLNTFSTQYEYIYCDNYLKGKIDLSEDRITLYFSNTLFSFVTNIIYSRKDAFIELTKYDNIIGAIDNLISINRKLELKDALKRIVNDTIVKEIHSNTMKEKSSMFFNYKSKDIGIKLSL
jgi:hypothetical protein